MAEDDAKELGTHVAIPLEEVRKMVEFINVNVPTGMGQVLLGHINTGQMIHVRTSEAPTQPRMDPNRMMVDDAVPTGAEATNAMSPAAETPQKNRAARRARR